MTYPFNNPDVDPISQNQRINTLESRPSGGGGSGGGSPYQIPDFDGYPDNTIKVYPDVGLVGKVTIPPSPQVLPNVEMKYCFYRPMIAGGPFGPTFLFVREYNSVAWNIPTDDSKSVVVNLNHTIDCEDFYQEYILATNVKYVAGLFTPFNIPYTVSGGGYLMTFRFDFTIYPSSVGKSYIRMQPSYIASTKPSGYLSLPPGYRFLYEVSGMEGPPFFYVGTPVNLYAVFPPNPTHLSPGGAVCVTQLQDLPTVYKSIFPQTWTR